MRVRVCRGGMVGVFFCVCVGGGFCVCVRLRVFECLCVCMRAFGYIRARDYVSLFMNPLYVSVCVFYFVRVSFPSNCHLIQTWLMSTHVSISVQLLFDSNMVNVNSC